MAISSWPKKQENEFGDRGLKEITTRCMYCPSKIIGHRDKGREWFATHMERKHQDILEDQRSRPKIVRKHRRIKKDPRARAE